MAMVIDPNINFTIIILLINLPINCQIMKKSGGEKWVAEEEEGVLLPAADGSGLAFVPDILIEDSEFLLTVAAKNK